MFVRTKMVRGREYAYLVKNKWTSKGPRQKVVRYIGTVFSPERVSEQAELDLGLIRDARIFSLFRGLIIHELKNHGFTNVKGVWVNSRFEVDLVSHKVSFSGRNAAIRLNEGFLCHDTISQLKKLMLREDITGKQLAESVLEAGISISAENFVELYSRLMPDTQS